MTNLCIPGRKCWSNYLHCSCLKLDNSEFQVWDLRETGLWGKVWYFGSRRFRQQEEEHELVLDFYEMDEGPLVLWTHNMFSR